MVVCTALVKQWLFPLNIKLERRCGYVLLANYRKRSEFKTVPTKDPFMQQGPVLLMAVQ